MRTSSLLSTLMVITAGVGAAVATQACGSSSATIDATKQSTVIAACMHICQCEAGTPDPTCQTDCDGGTGSSSSISSSLSSKPAISSGQLTIAPQACIDCFATASCTDIVNGTACASACP